MPRSSSKASKKDEKVVTTITVRDSVHQKVKLHAVREKVSASSVYEAAAEKYLKQQK